MYRIGNADQSELTGQIIGCAMQVHRTLGPGFLENVYHNALCLELSKAGVSFETEKRLLVHYDGKPVGDFEADLIVEKSVIIELKATQALVTAHEVQLVNYLNAAHIEIGLLLNFGAQSLEFKKKFRQSLPAKKQVPAIL